MVPSQIRFHRTTTGTPRLEIVLELRTDRCFQPDWQGQFTEEKKTTIKNCEYYFNHQIKETFERMRPKRPIFKPLVLNQFNGYWRFLSQPFIVLIMV